jgi:hypothetical protein
LCEVACHFYLTDDVYDARDPRDRERERERVRVIESSRDARERERKRDRESFMKNFP